MEASRRLRAADPEFDSSPSSPVRLRDFDPLEHQRLVVNPFLAVLGLLVLGSVEVSLRFPGALLLAPFFFLLPSKIQYHCLDCGHTGSFSRRARHACPAVFARWQERHRSGVWFPSSWAQLVVWAWVLGSVGLLLLVQSWG